MNDILESPTPITRELVPDDQRMEFVEQKMSIHFPFLFEPYVYSAVQQMTQDQYSGGFWNFYQLSNGGWYMAPEGDKTYRVTCANYWSGELSADALGIVGCLIGFSHLSFTKVEVFARLCAENYHQLREYMYDHPEVQPILRAID